MVSTYFVPFSYFWHQSFIQIFIVHESCPFPWPSLLLALHLTLSISHYQLAAAAAEQALECHRLFKFQISWFTIFHLCWETESFDKNVLWHLPRKWKECIWINVAKIFTQNHNSTPYKHLSLQPANAKVSQKYSWKKNSNDEEEGGGEDTSRLLWSDWWHQATVFLSTLPLPSLFPANPFPPLSSKIFGLICIFL